MQPPDRVGEQLARGLAGRSTRRSLLGKIGGAALTLFAGRVAAAAAGVPGSQPLGNGYYGFCGHTFTTGSCPSPQPLPRLDQNGLPVRISDGRPIDDLGRLVDAQGLPVDERGKRLFGPDGRLLDRAPRTRICEDWVPERFGVDARRQGSWYRCCNGRVRRLRDCCSTSGTRINGDASLVGYCYGGRRVFCVTYQETQTPC